MYGMVNKAVHDMVVSRFGEETWQEIKERAGVSEPAFLSNEGYDDAITYDLVGAATEVLGLSAEAILEAFGEYWVLETAAKGYGEMMDAGGSSLREFLENLPEFHSRVILVLPKLRPPEFRVTEATDDSLLLHYHSHREGLQPFVIGLVKGLGKRFETSVEVALERGRADGLDHDEFRVRWSTPA